MMSQEDQTNQEWYLDSGATNHVTSDLSNLNIQADYKGKNKLIVGNGSSLPILHIGDSTLKDNQKNLLLKNIMHVPNIT